MCQPSSDCTYNPKADNIEMNLEKFILICIKSKHHLVCILLMGAYDSTDLTQSGRTNVVGGPFASMSVS